MSGTTGDIGITSLWKILPINSGAVLYVNNSDLVNDQEAINELRERQNQYPAADRKQVYLHVISSILNYMETRYSFPSHLIKHLYRKVSTEENEHKASEQYLDISDKVKISPILLRIVQGLSLEEISVKRRKNYNYWMSRFNNEKGVNAIFDGLPEGVCPRVFPVLVEDVAGFANSMLDEGITIEHWPKTLPGQVTGSADYPVANYLASHLVILPVHQSLDLQN